MEKEGYLVRFRWGPRLEDSTSIADRLCRLLNRLASIDPLFRSWQFGKPGKEKPVRRTRPALKAACDRGVIRSDLPPYPPVEPPAYQLSFWTKAKWVLWLSGACGSDVENWNSLIMQLPCAGPEGKRLCNTKSLEAIMRAFVESWDPDSGEVYATHLYDALEITDWQSNRVDVGWLTYVARRFAQIPTLPSVIRLSEVKNAGTIIVTTSKPFRSTNMSHRDAAKMILKALNPHLQLARSSAVSREKRSSRRS